jgi:hypothetical protein
MTIDGNIGEFKCNFENDKTLIEMKLKLVSRRGQCKIKGTIQLLLDIDENVDVEVSLFRSRN